MHSIVPTLLALVAAAPAGPAVSQESDSVVFYSAGLEALLVSPKDATLADALEHVGPSLVSFFESMQVEVDDDLLMFAHGALTHPVCFRLGQDEVGRPLAQLTVRYDDESEAQWAAETFVQQLGTGGFRFERPSEGSTGMVAMTPGGPLTVDAGVGPAGARLAVSLGATREETFQFSDTGLPGEVEPAMFARFDGARLGAMIRPIVEMMGTEMPILPMLLLETLGRPDSPAFTFASGVKDGRGLVVCRSLGGAAAGRRTGTLVEQPLGAHDFARIPADATWASLAQWNPSSYLSQLDRIQPGMVDGAIAQLAGMTGVDVRADLLAHIGPTVSAYTSRSTGGGLFSGVLVLESGDSEAVALSVESLWEIVAPLIAAQTEGHVDVRAWQTAGVPCATLVFPGLPLPFEPSFAAADGAIVCALGRGALSTAVEQLASEKGLTDHPRLSGMPEESLQGLVGFSFYDTPRFVLDGYGTLAIGAGALANLMHEPGSSEGLAANVLPTPRVLAARVRPSISLVRVRGDDIVSTTSRDASCLVRCSACLGGPLGESQMLSLGIPIVASIAIPNLMSARLSANESATIATLRNLTAAQAQFQAVGVVDVDNDGVGEYGYFGELCGVAPLRVEGPNQAVVLGSEALDPPYLAMSLAPQPSPSGVGVVVRSGYVFQMWLPDANGDGIAEAPNGGANRTPRTSAEAGETAFVAYAWPVEFGQSGRRAFCVTQNGDIIAFDNGEGQYAGLPGAGRAPAFDAALAADARTEGWRHAPHDQWGGSHVQGSDGNVWTMLGY